VDPVMAARAADPETAARAADPETAARAADPETMVQAVDPVMAARAADPETAVRHMLLMMMVHPVETQVAVLQVMAQVPVVAAVIITTAILALAAQMAVLEAAPVVEVRALEMTAQEVAIPVMVPRTTVPIVAGLEAARHTLLIAAFRPETSLEQVWLMPPMETYPNKTGMKMVLMQLRMVNLPAIEIPSIFGLY
jgi:hypothetical protein